jgi:Putative Flp pilus-assembly TadE/G-like
MRAPVGRRVLKSQHGQVILFTALLIIPILGMVGIATDSGYLFFTRRAMQTAADSAALAGSFDQANNASTTEATVIAAAKADSKTNGFEDGVDNVTVTVHTPPTSGSFTDADYVEVIIQKTVPTVFLKMLSLIGTDVGDKTVKARAVAGRASVRACFVAMNSSASGAMNVSGSATINTPGCGIFVNSSSSTALTSGSTGQCVTNLSTDVVGNKSLACTFSPTPVPGTGAVTDPLATLTVPTRPSGACVSSPSSGTISDNSRAFCTISLSGSTTFASDKVYYIDGVAGGTGFSASGGPGTTINGTNVMFYVANGSVDVSTQVAMNITAPTTGTYAGIFFFMARTNDSATTFNGSGASNCKALTGIYYALSSDISFGGGGSGSCSTTVIFVADTISVAGSFNIGSPLIIPQVKGKPHLTE